MALKGLSASCRSSRRLEEEADLLRRALILTAVFVGTRMLDAAVVFARAGGGGGYSSGGSSSSSASSGHSSGGGSSSGSGGVELGLFELVCFLALLALAYHASRQHRLSLAASRARRQSESTRVAAQIVELDPAFERGAFLRRVERAFSSIQEAWSDQDLSGVRGFMSDGLYERFSIQLREQDALGYRNEMADVEVLEISILESRFTSHFQTLSVEIRARATDFRVDAETGKEMPSTRRSDSFKEVWHFLRAREARTEESGGLLEGQCPNCSAPIEPERAWHCSSCASELSSAPPDWVLTEITQRSEWSGLEAEELPGLKAVVDRDPGLTVEQIEDRASVLFWRIVDAQRTGSLEVLRSTSRPAFLESERARIESHSTRYVGDCSVGSADLRGLIAGREWDRAIVEIRWAGSVFERLETGPPRELNERKLHRSYLVMVRRCESRSQIGRCVTSAHCGACGAPDMGSLDGKCTFCGVVLNDGRDWLIDRFLELGDDEVGLLLREARGEDPEPEPGPAAGEPPAPAPLGPSVPGGSELLAWCLLLVYADADVDRRERESLVSWAEKLGVSPPTARQMMRAAQFGKLEVGTPEGPIETRRWLDSLAELASADGRLDRRERAVLDRFAARVASS